ncbi:MAG: SDR family oxidoreductase [Candidatus Methanofastidiosa archaeon]|nr:SDR family oxidoreductase [Candidatus Methanofastidiosa archaeon]
MQIGNDKPVVIVAGGTGGIGNVVCKRLAGDGYQVISASRGKTVPNTKNEDNIIQIACDVTSENDCHILVQTAVDLFGRVDCMVYAVIGYYYGLPQSHSAIKIGEVFASNVFGAHLLSSACYLHAMKKAKKGSICFIGSTVSTLALPNRSAYCASKAALVGLCRALAIDWARSGVRVNCVTTAYVATELEINGAKNEEWGHGLDDLIQRIPLGRLANPKEIASAVAWVISEESSYLTGSELIVDGGWSAFAGLGHD